MCEFVTEDGSRFTDTGVHWSRAAEERHARMDAEEGIWNALNAERGNPYVYLAPSESSAGESRR